MDFRRKLLALRRELRAAPANVVQRLTAGVSTQVHDKQGTQGSSADQLNEIRASLAAISATLTALQKSQAHGFEYLDKKIYETNGEVVEARRAIDIGLHRLLGRVSSLATSLDASAISGAGVGSARYLDLLEADLTGTLHGDVSAAPWTKEQFDPARREVGRDWPKTAATMIGTARMRNLRHLCERALAENIPGDFIETGVWRGGACIYMRAIIDAYGDKSRRVFVADSFAGLPPPNAQDYPADKDDTHYQYDQLAISRQDVENNFRRYGLLDGQVVFLEGWFKDTLPRAPIDKLAILRLDGDMYESTIQALDALYAKVSPGGFVIVDDYVLKPCADAVDDFRKRHGIDAPLVDVDGAAVWWRVPA